MDGARRGHVKEGARRGHVKGRIPAPRGGGRCRRLLCPGFGASKRPGWLFGAGPPPEPPLPAIQHNRPFLTFRAFSPMSSNACAYAFPAFNSLPSCAHVTACSTPWCLDSEDTF